MPLCPISEIPALHSLGLWPKLEALQILRRSQKIREAPTESPFVVSTLHSLHYMHHLNWSSVARTSAVNWDLRVLWMLYGFMKLCLRYILSKCFDIAFACFLIHGPWICFQLSMQPKLSPSPEDTATPLLVERGLLEKHEKHWASYTPSFRGILFLKLAGPRRARWSRRQCSGGPSCQEKWELMGINNMFGANLYKVGQGWNTFPISRLYWIGIFVTNLSWNIQRQILVQ